MKKKEPENGLVRVALYVRVSGEEQKIKGLSLEAQQERLESYAKEKGWLIVGTYIDAAKTARKNMYKRSEFMRMMESVKRDEIDLLLFCRLDRWFRSVADYYKVMEVLDAHNCGWKTTDEDYDTTTANGRLYINVKLSIAQNEADICGERIDVVFDSKIAHGTVISGNCPFGYRVNNEKRLEIAPDQAAIIQDAFDYYEQSNSQRDTAKYIREKYGVNWAINNFRTMLANELYTGVYNKNGRYNDKFCPAIISKEQYEHIQELLKRNIRRAPTGRVFIFTSILICAECEHALVGAVTRGTYYYYRCNQFAMRGRCTHQRQIREEYIEQWLFENLAKEIKKSKIDWEIRAAQKKKTTFQSDKAVLKSKLTKLKELYVNDLIDLAEYKKDYEIYTAALQQIQEPTVETPPDFAAVERILESDFRKIYDSLTREDKRSLWRSVIKELRIDNEKNITSISFY